MNFWKRLFGGKRKSRENLKQLAVSRSADLGEFGSLHMTGGVLQARGDLIGALATYRELLAIAERMAAADPGDVHRLLDLAYSHDKIGEVLEAQGDLNGALTAYRESMAFREQLAGSDPTYPQWQHDLAVCHVKLAKAYKANGDPRKAVQCMHRSRELLRKMKRSGMDLDPQDAKLLAELEKMP